MYQLTENIQGELKKVSPKALKLFKDCGFFEAEEDSKLQELIFKTIIDTDKFDLFIDAIFKVNGIVKFEDDVDYYEIIRGTNDFFVKFTPPSPS